MRLTAEGSFFVIKKYAWALILLGSFLSACGYRFAGGGSLPSGITSISVEMFENRTGETGVENIITNDLIYEFTRHEQVVVTGSEVDPQEIVRFPLPAVIETVPDGRS